MAIKEDREYRSVPMAFFATEQRSEGDEESFMVEGYASTFEPYVLLSYDGIDYKEQIDPKAFDEADMSDVIFCKDHQGTVFARTRNNTLSVMADEKGLYTRTNLSKTASAREMYEEIKAGMYDQMSFAFIVEDEEYDMNTHTRTIKRIGKVFDVSAVSFPANPGTDISAISARNYVNGVIDMEQAERLAEQKKAEEQRRLDAAKAKFYYYYALAGGKKNES
jgi:hypothetical protein